MCFIHHPFKIYTSNIVNHHYSNMLVNSSSMRNSSLLSSSAKFGIHIENLNIHDWLAGWWYTYLSEKYEFVSRDYHSQYMER